MNLIKLLPLLLINFFVYSQKNNTSPNFLFILVDDLPHDANGFSGRYPFLKTPNIDRLANEGVNVKNFFVTQSICSPSRASFLNGTYPHIHGVNQNNRHVDPDWNKFPSYATHLQKQGYQSAHIGKIHMAHSKGKKHIRPGFDYWYSFNGQGDYFNPEVNDNGLEYQEKGYITDILTDKTVDWLINKRESKKPFILNLWHKAVHEKHLPAPRHKKLYIGENLPLPPFDTHKETFDGKPEWQRKKTYGAKWKNYLPIPEKLEELKWPIRYQKNIKLLRSLAAVDESIGTVLKTLEELGELENTVVIFSSDNGYFMGEHTFKDKRLAYENSMRVPMLIRYPKIFKDKSVVDEQCLNIDLAPTILDMAGIEKPDYMQGESMLDLLIGKSDSDWRNSFLFEYYRDSEWPHAGPNQVAVRTMEFKLVESFIENDIDELYDLVNDPGEMNNLINDSRFDEKENELRLESLRLQKKYKYNPDRDWHLRTIEKNRKLNN